MNQPNNGRPNMSFCAAAGAEAARRWLLSPIVSMAEYRDNALTELLCACDEAQYAAERATEFANGFAAGIAREIVNRATDPHYLASKALRTQRRIPRGYRRKPHIKRQALMVVAERGVL